MEMTTPDVDKKIEESDLKVINPTPEHPYLTVVQSQRGVESKTPETHALEQELLDSCLNSEQACKMALDKSRSFETELNQAPGMKQSYIIKPFKWTKKSNTTTEWHEAIGSWGSYCATRDREDFEETGKWGPWRMKFCFDEYYDEGDIECKSLKEAKEAAFADWIKRILPHLAPTKTPTT